MKYLFKVTMHETKTLLNGVDFEISNFNINFKDGTSIKFSDINDIVAHNGQFIIYSTDEQTLKYARRILSAYYKSNGVDL